jgi:O-antigen ligase
MTFFVLPAARVRSWAVRPELWLFLLACGVGVAYSRLPLIPAGLLLLAAAILLLTIIHPLAGLAFTLLAAPWAALENIILVNLPVDSGQLLFLLTVASWMAWSIARDRRLRLPTVPLLLPLLLFLGVAGISLLNAPSLTAGLRELLKWVEMTLLMLIVVDIGRAYQKRWWAGLRIGDLFVGLVLLSALSQALIGIWQFAPRGHGPEHFEILNGFYRAYGTFEQPNPYGGFMAMMALLAVGTAVGGWSFGQRKEKADGEGSRQDVEHQPRSSVLYVVFLLLCAAACGVAVVLSWSRGAWLGFAAGGAIFALFWPRQRSIGVLLVVGGFIAFLLALQLGLVPVTFADRFLSFGEDLQFGDVRGADINDANYAVLERLAHWQSALDMANDHPWLGVGFGNYEAAYAEYALINWPYPLGHAHNYYLNILAETGIVGTLAYLLLWGVVFWQSLFALNRLDGRQRGIALGLLAGWSALTVHHLLDNLYVNNMFLHYGVLFGGLQLLYIAARGRVTAHSRLKKTGMIK